MEKVFVKINNPAYCKRVNNVFCNSIQPLVEKIFDGDINNHAIGYQYSKNENISYNQFKPIIDTTLLSDEYQTNLTDDFQNTNKLGNIEIRFINFILLAREKLIVLKGYRGTGKSELIRYVSKFMTENRRHDNCPFKDKCKNKEIKHIFIDFKEDECSGEHFQEVFYSKLFQKLGQFLSALYSDETVINSFINNSQKMDYFLNLNVDLIEKEEHWSELTNYNKYIRIFSWIKREYNLSTERLSALYEMIKFYNTNYPIYTSCFGLIIDNIDQLRIEQQNEVVTIANNISNATNIWVVIPVRLTTFNNIRGNAGCNFWAASNFGYPPLDLCLLRIKHYLEHRNDSYYKALNIPKQYINAFNERLEFIYNKLIFKSSLHIKPSNRADKYDYDRLAKTFEALAGVSIRKCLRLFRRLFLNYVIEWNDVRPPEDLLIRSLYSYMYENGKMDQVRDNRVHNIFCTDTGLLTLSKLRLLNLVWGSEVNSYSIKIRELRDILKHYGDVNDETFRELRKNLWTQGKRIIILKDVGTCEDEEKIQNAIVEITASGKGHIKYLCKDLQYIQNCFEVVDLNNLTAPEPDEAIEFVDNRPGDQYHKKLLINRLESMNEHNFPDTIDYKVFGSRMKFIGSILRFLYLKDVIETINYLYSLETKGYRTQQLGKITNLISAPIIIAFTQSILNISQRGEHSINFSEELDYWIDFINTISEFNSILFPGSSLNKEFIFLINRINQYRSA